MSKSDNLPLSELGNMKLVIPDEESQENEDELLVTIKQQELDENDLAEFFEDDQVKPQWNVRSELRNTEFVPTVNNEQEEEDEVDMKVYNAEDHEPRIHQKKNKMNTIKEAYNEDENQSEDSDAAYFNGDEDEFNNRDDDYYDEEEEKEYDRRRELLENEDDIDNEDNQPYEEFDEEDQYEQEQREKEEFGDDEDDDDTEYTEQERKTMCQDDKYFCEKEIQQYKKRIEELKVKIERKQMEGIAIASEQQFYDCLIFFYQKANNDDLSEKDMLEINEFVNTKINHERSADFTAILLQVFYMKEELISFEKEIQDLKQRLNESS